MDQQQESTPIESLNMGTRLANRLLLIGWDGVEFGPLRTFLAEGRLPILSSLLEKGALLELTVPRPAFPHTAWTSLATGKRPHEHGVLYEFCPSADGSQVEPISRYNRESSALWNLLHRAGLQTHLIGWPVSHPAEILAGIYVSDRFALPQFAAPHTQQDGPTVLPREAQSHLNGLRATPPDVEEITLGQLLPAHVIGVREYSRLEAFCRDLLAQTATLFRAIRWCLNSQPWDFSACVFPGIRRAHDLASWLRRLSPTATDLCQQLITGCYEYHDLLLGQVLSQVDDSTHLILLSPTGGQAVVASELESDRSSSNYGSTTRNTGLTVLTGPGIRHLASPTPRSVLDITPTILTMFGLPFGVDMAGRPLVELFESDLAPTSVPTWETQSLDNDLRRPTESADLDEELSTGAPVPDAVEHLLELGYVDPLDVAAQDKVMQCLLATELNRVTSLIDSGLNEQAITVLKELKAEHKESFQTHFLLAEALYRTGQFEAARREIKSLMCQGIEKRELYLLSAANSFADHRYDLALEELACTRRGSVLFPGASLMEGSILLRKSDFTAAEKAFQKAIKSEGPSAQSLDGLATVKLHFGLYEDAALHAIDAIEKDMQWGRAHYHLGVALYYLHKPQEALGALRNWGAIEPQAIAPYWWMARVYELLLKDRNQAEACRQNGREAIYRRRRARCANQREGT